VSVRCALTESSLTQKLMRDKMKFYLQGVHSVCKVCIDKV
jgi:hypothetical protein